MMAYVTIRATQGGTPMSEHILVAIAWPYANSKIHTGNVTVFVPLATTLSTATVCV
jgi:hypothetical protein